MDEKNGVKKEYSNNNAQEVMVELFVAIEETCMKVVHVPMDESWIINNAASCHMANHKYWYTSLHLVENDILVIISNDVKFLAKRKDMIFIK